MDDIEFIKGLVDTINNNRKMIVEMKTSSRARIVWSVGIAGFALLNAKLYWESLAGAPITGVNNAWLSLPWVLTTFLGVITYFVIDEAIKKDEIFFAYVINALNLFEIDLMENPKADVIKLRQIVRGEDTSVIKEKTKMVIWNNWARRFELLTFLTLVSGFVWSAIGPFVLK